MITTTVFFVIVGIGALFFDNGDLALTCGIAAVILLAAKFLP